MSEHKHTDTGSDSYRLPDTGDLVHDRETEEPRELIVMETNPEIAADDHTIDRLGVSVAEMNPEYDAAAPVVECVYLAAVNDALDQWLDVDDIQFVVDWGDLKTYSFPADRLGWSE